jgi:outer membrane protein assembly factor BamB
MKIRLLVLFICSLVQGCSQVDDYMLGKDNTPKPKDLKQIEPQIKVSQNWSSPVGKAHKT